MTDQTQDTIPHTLNLKPKHRRFVDAYFRLALNATDAYQAAYPKASYDAARVNGSKLLTDTNIRAEIDRRFSEQVMAPSEVLRRLSDMSRANLLPFIRITPEGFTYFDFSHPDAKNYFHLIKKIKTKRTRRVEGKGENAEEWEDEWVEVELHDAQAALEKIGKYHHLFREEVDLTSKGESIAQKEDNAERFDRAISSLADAIRESIPGKGTESDGALGSAEPPAMAGAPKPGG